MQDNKYYREIAFKYFDGEASPKERIALFDFISENSQNQKIYHLWENEYREKCMSDIELNKLWLEFRDKNEIRYDNSISLVKEKKNRKFYPAILKVACVLFILILSNYIIYKNTSTLNIADEITLLDYYVPNGEIKTIYLADSSCITLNAGSYILYPEKFSQTERTIYIYGEAHLDVRKDQRPFYVKTHEFKIEVLGTVFDVYTYPHEVNSIIALESGSINLLFNNTEKIYNLLPSEKIRYNRITGDIIKDSSITYSSGWMNGILQFEKTPLPEVIERLERKFDINIHMLKRDLFDYKATVTFMEEESLTEVLEILLKLIPDIKGYTIHDKDVYIE